jgi:hypothetical protein
MVETLQLPGLSQTRQVKPTDDHLRGLRSSDHRLRRSTRTWSGREFSFGLSRCVSRDPRRPPACQGFACAFTER